MKTEYLIRNGNPELLLFFSGWGGEPNLFSDHAPGNADFLLCYDYRSLEFSPELLSGYGKIKVAAWSLGVWVASRVLQDLSGVDYSEKIAVNGTEMPVSDLYGIPEAVFKGTLERLDESGMAKFRRRMCGSREGLENFMSHHPGRQVDDLRDELSFLYDNILGSPAPDFAWDRAVIGSEDRIFPAANQMAAWAAASVPATVYDEPHYSEMLFRNVL